MSHCAASSAPLGVDVHVRRGQNLQHEGAVQPFHSVFKFQEVFIPHLKIN